MSALDSEHSEVLAQVGAGSRELRGGRGHGDAAIVEDYNIVSNIEDEFWTLE